jgi:hypothetical protein
MKHLVFAALLASAAASSFANTMFNLTFTPGTSAVAQQGFRDAAARWSSLLKDNVTIDLTVGFNPLGPGILGLAQSAESFYSYNAFRTALTSDAKSTQDATAVAHLQPGNSFNMLINRTSNNPNGAGSATPYLDNNGNANNTTMSITIAEAKALALPYTQQQLSGCTVTCDGFIQFSSNFTFDFDSSNGIAANAFDFVGVAAHEIGHSPRGGIGRRAWFRSMCRKVWGFESLRGHQRTSQQTENSAHVAELVDAHGSGPCRKVPSVGTKLPTWRNW